MGSSAHADALSQKHQRLEEKIEEEMARPRYDEIHVQKLKREKLKIKDELSRQGYAGA